MRQDLRSMALDKKLIAIRVDIIERNLNEIRNIAKEGLKNYRNELAAKHALLESIEACIDISNHIISAKGFRRPVDYKDMFEWQNSGMCWYINMQLWIKKDY